jgi:hypothetical protein
MEWVSALLRETKNLYVANILVAFLTDRQIYTN